MTVTHNCWVEVNLGAIRDNFRAIQSLIGPDTRIMAVIKANAYGHGAVEVARALTAEGADYFAVTSVGEAVPLRLAGVLTPVLLLMPALPGELDALVSHRITACITCYDDAVKLSQEACRQNSRARAHLKINTGMGRLGVEPEECVQLAQQIVELPNIELEAAFTHLAQAGDSATMATRQQYARFQSVMHHLILRAGISPQGFHCANSAALLRFASMRMSRVRPGTLIYGQYPSKLAAEAGLSQGLELREGFQVKARIRAIRELRHGDPVGYGSEWWAGRPSRIATLAVGYADGLSQEPRARQESFTTGLTNSLRRSVRGRLKRGGSPGGEAFRQVTINGQPAAIVGRIAMQQCSIDITDLTDVKVGDETWLYMRRTSAGSHLPRVYVENR